MSRNEYVADHPAIVSFLDILAIDQSGYTLVKPKLIVSMDAPKTKRGTYWPKWHACYVYAPACYNWVDARVTALHELAHHYAPSTWVKSDASNKRGHWDSHGKEWRQKFLDITTLALDMKLFPYFENAVWNDVKGVLDGGFRGGHFIGSVTGRSSEYDGSGNYGLLDGNVVKKFLTKFQLEEEFYLANRQIYSSPEEKSKVLEGIFRV